MFDAPYIHIKSSCQGIEGDGGQSCSFRLPTTGASCRKMLFPRSLHLIGQWNKTSCTLMYLSVLKYRMTFWPRFPISRNEPGNCFEVKDMLTSRPAPSTEFWRSSCRHSQIDWRPHICKVLLRCIIAHSKTPVNLHTKYRFGGTDVDVLGMGGGHVWAWNVS